MDPKVLFPGSNRVLNDSLAFRQNGLTIRSTPSGRDAEPLLRLADALAGAWAEQFQAAASSIRKTPSSLALDTAGRALA